MKGDCIYVKRTNPAHKLQARLDPQDKWVPFYFIPEMKALVAADPFVSGPGSIFAKDVFEGVIYRDGYTPSDVD
jgi:hypothetical protein